MTVLIYIHNYVADEKEILLINKNNVDRLKSFNELNSKKNSLDVNCTRSELFYFLKEINLWTNLRLLLIQKNFGDNININVVRSQKETIDYKWCFMTSITVWHKVETDNILSWLSTLGGGYSALGDHFTHCAETAAKISLKQLALGNRIGDPFLQARCKLFYSISLIQTGKLKQAKKLIRDQYAFAITQNNIDNRLVKMCEGIWLKLQYYYKIKLEQNKYNCK